MLLQVLNDVVDFVNHSNEKESPAMRCITGNSDVRCYRCVFEALLDFFLNQFFGVYQIASLLCFILNKNHVDVQIKLLFK